MAIYQTTRRHITEYHNLDPHRSWELDIMFMVPIYFVENALLYKIKNQRNNYRVKALILYTSR
jgi:hypothetical protein